MVADLFTDHIDRGVCVWIFERGEEQLSQDRIKWLLYPFFHCTTNIVLSLETGKEESQDHEHATVWARFERGGSKKSRTFCPVGRKFDQRLWSKDEWWCCDAGEVPADCSKNLRSSQYMMLEALI